MSTMTELRRDHTKAGALIAGACGIVLFWGTMAVPNLMRSRMASNQSSAVARQRAMQTELASGVYYAPAVKAKPVARVAGGDGMKPAVEAPGKSDAAAERKIIRTSALEIVVRHPVEAAEKIAAAAARLGGYVVSAQGGGEDAAVGALTICVPAARFEEARAEIRKLGLRVESERIEAQDVTRQYVDQDAGLRNLRAEEAQYLAILKQASTVKDMLTVSEKLGDVRGQIEQQQAEFNALSKRIETAAIAISLRTEAEAQVFGLTWRPGYQLKLALRDGLESVASYATAMTTILFYLPAVVLWLATILAGAVVGWKMARWVGRRLFGWEKAAVAPQA